LGKRMAEQDKKSVIMVAYSNYLTDARIRREAETLASTQEYEVTVLALRNGAQSRSYTNGGVAVRELKTAKYQGKSLFRYMLSYLCFTVEASRLCNKMFSKKKVWAIHIHNIPNFLVFAALFPRLLGGKVILDVHDSVPETFAAKFGNRGLLFRLLCLEESLSCRLANRIICVNHPQKETLVCRGIDSRKIAISMNVPDPRIFKAQGNGEDREKTADGFKMVYHGTLAKRLGLDLAIKAVAKLAPQIPGLEFYVLGSGDDKEEFQELARNLKVDKIVHFPGMIPLEKLEDILKGMDLGVVANRKNIATELMLPVKMMEYIALGIPVAASRLRAIEYYFDDEMVGYFEPESVDSLAERILALYRDPSRRRNQAEKARAFLERYGWEKHQFELLNLYRDLSLKKENVEC
jgi:glycosyltransferase involved in cell wall biosynthesis